MTPEEVEAYQTARRGKYGWIVDGAEILTDTEPSTPWWKYADNYTLEARNNKK